MAHIWSQAARNLGRNRRRTVVTGLALALGVTLCIGTFGLMDGMNAQILHSLTRFDLGHVQVHPKKYVDESDLSSTLSEPEKIIQLVEDESEVVGAAPRLYGFGLLSGAGKSAGIQLMGVNPELEAKVTEIDENIRKGAYLSPEATEWPPRRALSDAERTEDVELTQRAVSEALSELDDLDGLSAFGPEASSGEAEPNELGKREQSSETERSRELQLAQSPPPKNPLPVLMGDKLSSALGVKVGDRLFLSTSTSDGQNESVFVRLKGVFSTGTQTLDRNRLYLHLDDLRHLLHQEGEAHEVSIVLSDVENSATFASALAKRVSTPDVLVRPWDKIRPEINQMIELNSASTGIMIAVILFVAALGVVNTMLMAVFERTRELGVLKAIGMSPLAIVKMMLAESTLLVLMGTLAGATGGLFIDLWLITSGLDLSEFSQGMSMGNVGLNPVIYGVITPKGVLMPVIVLVSLCLIASLVPAIRAARLQPAIGMRET